MNHYLLTLLCSFALMSCTGGPGLLFGGGDSGLGGIEDTQDTESELSDDTESDDESNTDEEPDDTDEEPDDTGEEPDDTDEEPDDTDEEPDDTGEEPDDTDEEEKKRDCPENWHCVELADNAANTCESNIPDWVHFTGYICGESDAICCGPPGESKGKCDEQPAMSCSKTCGDGLVENTDYYCKDDTKTCCADPEGPMAGCVEAGGQCVSMIQSCANRYSPSDLSCQQFYQCCLPPACPWDCEEFNGANTCSDQSPPDAVRNYEYSCERSGDVCCQPLDDDSGITKNCNDQPNMACKASCMNYEDHQKNYYCETPGRLCCDDFRQACTTIGGVCQSSWGNCANGTEDYYGGKCANNGKCCTPITNDNACIKQGGFCINPKNTCPSFPPHLPLPTTCGAGDSRQCCLPLGN